MAGGRSLGLMLAAVTTVNPVGQRYTGPIGVASEEPPNFIRKINPALSGKGKNVA